MKNIFIKCSFLLLLSTLTHQAFSQGKARFNQNSYVMQGLKLSKSDKEALIKEYSKTPAENYLLIIDGETYGKASVSSVIKSAKAVGHTGVPDIKGGIGNLADWCILVCTVTTTDATTNISAATNTNKTGGGVIDMSRLAGRDIQTRMSPVLQKYNVKVVDVTAVK